MLRSRSQAVIGIDPNHLISDNPLESITSYESEVKYDAYVEHETMNHHSDEEEALYYSTDSEYSLDASPSPQLQPMHPSYKYTATSFMRQSFSISMTQTNIHSVSNTGRPRSQTTKPRLNSQSFNHFRINSITIQPNFIQQTVDESDLESDEKSITDTYMETIDDEEDKTHVVIEAQPETNQRCKIIEHEIIDSEETYYRGLNILLNELMLPMFNNHLIEKKYFKQCVSNLPQLLAFHDIFLGQLLEVHTSANNIKSISQVLAEQNKEEFINLYLKYIRDYDVILELFGNTFHRNSKLQMFLKQKRKEKKPLTNFLIIPIQRITRYILLWTDLKKHTKETDVDYKNIASALHLMEEITNEINERKKLIENRTQCLQIQEALSNLTQSIVKPDRNYIKQYVFVKKSNKHQRQFFCFNDIIIVTNSCWQMKEIIDIRTVEIKIQPLKLNMKKSKSFGFGSFSKSKEDTDKPEVKLSPCKFPQFMLLYLEKVKPSYYIARTMDDMQDFDRLIKHNRLQLIDSDLAQQSGTSQIREALRENGVSQAEDYQQEIASIKAKRKRGDATADMHVYLDTPT